MKIMTVFSMCTVVVIAALLTSCRHNPIGPSGNGSDTTKTNTIDSTSLTEFQSMGRATITFGAKNLFAISYPYESERDYQDTTSSLFMESSNGLTSIGNSLAGTNTTTNVSIIYPYENIIQTDSFFIRLASDGKSIQTFNVSFDSNWVTESNRGANENWALSGDSIPLVSSSSNSMIFSLSGTGVRTHLPNIFYSDYIQDGCNVDWHGKDYDSTLWQSSDAIPRITVTLTK